MLLLFQSCFAMEGPIAKQERKDTCRTAIIIGTGILLFVGMAITITCAQEDWKCFSRNHTGNVTNSTNHSLVPPPSRNNTNMTGNVRRRRLH